MNSLRVVPVRLQGIHKAFNGKPAVTDLSFDVPAASVCGFLGPNGAGKTTTLRMILGMFMPDRGCLEVFGDADPTRHRARLSYLPEEKGLYKRMGVLEFLEFLGRLRGLSRTDARIRGQYWLQRFELGAVAHHRCETLSKGMGLKLQIAGALLHEPELIILDEPFSGLDPVNTSAVRDVVLELKRDGRTVILCTHVMEQAEQICDRVLLLAHGRQVLSGTLADVRVTGVRTLRVDYVGDGSVFAGLPGVAGVADAGARAELTLMDAADPDAILAALVGRIRIHRFEVTQRSLHEVFVQAVHSAEIARDETAATA